MEFGWGSVCLVFVLQCLGRCRQGQCPGGPRAEATRLLKGSWPHGLEAAVYKYSSLFLNG